MGDSHFNAFEIMSNNRSFVFINLYLPCCISNNLNEFLFCLAKINDFVDALPSPNICIICDFNSNIRD